ncbi:uncharacterized protein LOC130974242 [Arachis stenosperma]|uniref:uncharacterized protein LOC130974242 n=1 Tax=Arachis stenosperma TaxID=217475 RepID=UPI0025AC1E86|nr:uncharacterized protein LOC130974242 [Arachis stenosperma]
MDANPNSSPESGGFNPTMDIRQFTVFFNQVAQIQGHINKQSNPSQDPASPYFILPFKSPGIPITNVTLNGANYGAWSRAMERALKSKNKIKFIDDISQSVLWTNIAYELWNDLNHKYYQGDRFRVAELNEELYALKQGDLTVTAYFAKLKTIREELDNFRSIPMCACEMKYDCGLGIIRMQREEDRRELFGLDTTSDIKILASAAFSSNTARFFQGRGRGRGRGGRSQAGRGQGGRSKLHCSFYNKTEHIVDSYYKKHGYPPNYKQRFNNHSYNNSASPVLNCMTAIDNTEGDNENLSEQHQMARSDTTSTDFTPEQREAIFGTT